MNLHTHSKAQAMLKALLSASGHESELLGYLPSSMADETRSISLDYPLEAKSLLSPFTWAAKIHYSWFVETIQSLPNQVKPFFLSALPSEQRTAASQMLALHDNVPAASLFLRAYLMQILRNMLQETELLSEQHLPPSVLNILLKLEKKQLIHMADLLGIYDLAADLRQVVDRALLRKIHNVLNPEQLRFLEYCSKQPVKWISEKIGLHHWDGTQKQLNHLLHHRGLLRIAKATVKEDASFKWHLLHRFDVGRAKIIQKEFYGKQDPALLPYFKNQILHLAKRYSV